MKVFSIGLKGFHQVWILRRPWTIKQEWEKWGAGQKPSSKTAKPAGHIHKKPQQMSHLVSLGALARHDPCSRCLQIVSWSMAIAWQDFMTPATAPHLAVPQGFLDYQGKNEIPEIPVLLLLLMLMYHHSRTEELAGCPNPLLLLNIPRKKRWIFVGISIHIL